MLAPPEHRGDRGDLDDDDQPEGDPEGSLGRLVPEHFLAEQRGRTSPEERYGVEHVLGHPQPVLDRRPLVVAIQRDRRQVHAGEIPEKRGDRPVEREAEHRAHDEQRDEPEDREGGGPRRRGVHPRLSWTDRAMSTPISFPNEAARRSASAPFSRRPSPIRRQSFMVSATLQRTRPRSPGSGRRSTIATEVTSENPTFARAWPRSVGMASASVRARRSTSISKRPRVTRSSNPHEANIVANTTGSTASSHTARLERSTPILKLPATRPIDSTT